MEIDEIPTLLSVGKEMTDLLDVEESKTGIAVKTWMLFMYLAYRDLNNHVSLSNQAETQDC